jgi:hypothetical protein
MNAAIVPDEAFIAEVGALGLPDVVEMPFHSLNFVVSQEVPNTGLKVRLKISNIINQPYRFKVGGFGGLDEQSEILGTEFNLNISWSPTGIRAPKKAGDGA